MPDNWPHPLPSMAGPAVYRITVRGRLNADWAARFDGMAVTEVPRDDEGVETALEGRLSDQCALAGVLNTLYDLHLPVVSVQCLDASDPGRYAAFNFANAATIRQDNTLEATSSYLGFVGYRHFWTDKLRTNVNVSAVEVDNDAEISGDAVNKTAYSVSANLIYSPIPELHFGIEVMRGWREIESGATGTFDRFQFSAKYDFSFSETTEPKEEE